MGEVDLCRNALTSTGNFVYKYDSNQMMILATENPDPATLGNKPAKGPVAETQFAYDHTGQRFLKKHTRDGVAIKTWYLGDGIELREKYTGITANNPVGNFSGWQATKYIYGIDDKRLTSITGLPKSSTIVATGANLFALANSYSATTLSGIAMKTYYTFYGAYAYAAAAADDLTPGTWRIIALLFIAGTLIVYLVRGGTRPWVRATAFSMSFIFFTVNCWEDFRPPGVSKAEMNTLISDLYTGLPSGTVYYSHNHLGSGALVTDVNGAEVFRITYTEYGEIDLENSGRYNPTTGDIEHYIDDLKIAVIAVKYTGQELDPETNFYYYNARYYDPQLGVFTTSDSAFDADQGSFAFNRHMYVRGNPIMYSDPTGHFFLGMLLVPALFAGSGAAIRGAATGDWSVKNLALGAAQGLVALGALAVGIASGGSATGGLVGLEAAMVGGAVGGFAGGFTGGFGNALVEGNRFEDAFAAGIIGGTIGMVSGMALGAGGHYLGKAWQGSRAQRWWDRLWGRGGNGKGVQPVELVGNEEDLLPEHYLYSQKGQQYPTGSKYCNNRGCIDMYSGDMTYGGAPGDPYLDMATQPASSFKHDPPALDFGGRGNWAWKGQDFRVYQAGVNNASRGGPQLIFEFRDKARLTITHFSRINGALKAAQGNPAIWFRSGTYMGSNDTLLGRIGGKYFHLHAEGRLANGDYMSPEQMMRYIRGN